MLQGWKTIIGLGIAFVAQALQMAGIDVGDTKALTDAVNVSVTNLAELGGLLIALYGRIKAQTPVGGGQA